MTDIRQRKEDVKMHLKDLRQKLKTMHLEVTEELILPQPDDIKSLMNKMDQLLKLIESKQATFKKDHQKKTKNESNKKIFTNNSNCNILKFL